MFNQSVKSWSGRLIDFAHLNEINLELFSATHYFIERETWVSDIRRKFFGIQPTIVDFTKLWQKERIIKGDTGGLLC